MVPGTCGTIKGQEGLRGQKGQGPPGSSLVLGQFVPQEDFPGQDPALGTLPPPRHGAGFGDCSGGCARVWASPRTVIVPFILLSLDLVQPGQVQHQGNVSGSSVVSLPMAGAGLGDL